MTNSWKSTAELTVSALTGSRGAAPEPTIIGAALVVVIPAVTE